MAKDIRESIETQQWDMGNYSEEQVFFLVRSAFVEPVILSEFIKHTFVVGGGKKVRQKYDEKLSKARTPHTRQRSTHSPT